MGDTPLFLGLGIFIGIALFFVCERMGWLHKWSGLKDPRSKSVDPVQDMDEKAS